MKTGDLVCGKFHTLSLSRSLVGISSSVNLTHRIAGIIISLEYFHTTNPATQFILIAIPSATHSSTDSAISPSPSHLFPLPQTPHQPPYLFPSPSGGTHHLDLLPHLPQRTLGGKIHHLRGRDTARAAASSAVAGVGGPSKETGAAAKERSSCARAGRPEVGGCHRAVGEEQEG